jgi:signal transduction histidine kinase/ActR/RegA family two-component response regulator
VRLRTSLVALVVAGIVPVLIFASAVVVVLWRHDREATEARLRNTARALALAVDREVSAAVTTLEVLATSEYLERGDLRAFYGVAARAVESQRADGWLTIVLTSADGEHLVNPVRPLGAPLPPLSDAAEFAQVAATGRPSVSNLITGAVLQRPLISVRVPVVVGGRVRYVVSAAISNETFVTLLRQQNIPSDWLSSVFDRRGITIARTIAPERFVGLPAGEHILRAMKEADEGFMRAVTRDARTVYFAYSRAPFSGWIVTFSVPADLVDTPLRRSLASLVLGGALLTGLGIVLATTLARRLARPMAALARSATTLGRGEAAAALDAGHVDEVREVARALERAGEERRRAETALRQESTVLDAVNRAGRALSAELDVQKVVQAVTDAATTVSGAAFGAFFYNVTDARGESYMLYTLSGVPREAFAGFPMPRNTEIFAPTFRGEGVIRLDDVRKDARYGKNPPHHGMPTGHLPVVSYLAAPVVSRSGEVIGGLFFGHPEPGRFGEREEQAVVGLAAQAAIAIDNARLYEKQQQARQEAEAANRTKDEFLATLSHELRTPLNAILGWARMLEGGGLTAEGRDKAVGVIVRNARVQNQLVEDLLDVSRIVTGKLKLDVRPVMLPPVVEAAVDTIRPAADAKGVRLQTEIDPGGGPVLGDPERLQQVVWNLLSNAVKFTPRGGRVHVSLRRSSSHVEVVVGDTGPGIPPALLPVIFERFRQADSSSSRAHGGLGIGLALVRHLTEMHGGRVEVDSSGEGQGTTFTVTLPLLIHAGAPSDSRGHPRADGTVAASNAGALEGLKVLVVDDDQDAVNLFCTVLAGAGAETRSAVSAAHALAALDDWQPDVLVSDIEMPREDGYALIRRVRQRRDGLATVPAVAVTAYGRLEDRVRVLEAGFQMHIVKPVEPTELIAVITSLARRTTR